jgi:hypothetical protein
MTLDEMMNRFRVASRELFNNFFHVAGATSGTSWMPLDASTADGDDAYDLEIRFSHVEEVLFESLVCAPAKLTHVGYNHLQPEILVELDSELCPIMLNREINSGSWDFPVCEVTREARLIFIRFFDWDILDYRNNGYVLVQVDAWPSHPETVGKEALIESQYVHFVRAASPDRQTTD